MKLARVAMRRDSWSSRATAWKSPMSTVFFNLNHRSNFSTPKVTGIRQYGNSGSTDSTPSPARGAARDNARFKSDRPRQARRPWTSNEIKVIMEGCDAGLSARAIAKLLPDRTFGVVSNKVHSYLAHGASVFTPSPRGRWTQDEEARLLELHRGGLAIAEMKLQFPHRSVSSILSARKNLVPEGQVQPRRKMKPYTPAEIELVLALAVRRIEHRLIATLLNRTVYGVSNQINRLSVHGLRRNGSPEKHKRLLQLRRAGVSSLEVAGLLGTTLESAQARLMMIKPPETVIISPRRRQHNGSRLTPDQIKDIEDLRRKGVSWHAIQTFKFPELTKALLHTAYKRQGGHLLYKKGKLGSDALSMSSSDIELIQRLRHEGKTWQDISNLICPNKTPNYLACVFRRHLAMRDLEESKAATSSGSGNAS